MCLPVRRGYSHVEAGLADGHCDPGVGLRVVSHTGAEYHEAVELEGAGHLHHCELVMYFFIFILLYLSISISYVTNYLNSSNSLD